MKSRASSFVVLSFLLATGVCQAADEAALRGAIKAYDEAWAKGNKSAVEAFMAPELTWVGDGGVIGTRNELLAAIQPDPSGSIPPADFDIRLYGDVAVVSGVTGPDKKGSRFRNTSVWVVKAGRWLIVADHQSRITKSQ